MRGKRLIPVSLGVLAALAAAAAGALPAPSGIELDRLPLRFEANQGQLGGDILFVARGPGFSVALTRQGAVLTLSGLARRTAQDPAPDGPAKARTVEIGLVGADPQARVRGEAPSPAHANYFLGSDPSRWRSGVPIYGEVRYAAVYPGIDLVFHGRNGRLEYDFVVAPGADPQAIELRVRGADRVGLDADGALAMSLAGRALLQPRPVIYQETAFGRTPVAGGYAVIGGSGGDGERVRFVLADYDRARPLVIDPTFAFVSYFGGEQIEEAFGVGHDSAGNVWVSGLTASPDLPLAAPLDGAYGGAGDAFLTKFSPKGEMLVATYLGGSSFDQSWALTVDKANNLYVVGDTKSTDFPVVGGLQKSLHGERDAWIAKLDPTGSHILFSTFLGGSGIEFAYAIDLDAKGAMFVSGETESPDFPTGAAAAQPAYGGGTDGFVVKLNADATALLYSTYLGGANFERAWGVRIDAKGRAYVGGQTASPNFPVVKAFQDRYSGGTSDAFMTALSADGAHFLYSTLCGGTSTDQTFGVAVDAQGNARYTGHAGNATFPVKKAIQSHFGGGDSDAFIVALSPTGALQYSTFVGGSLADAAFGIALDGRGNVYITGQTESPDYPVRHAEQPHLGGLRDGFLTKLRSDGKVYVFSTFFGGPTIDEGVAVDVDARGQAFIAGFSDGGFPLVDAAQRDYGGLRDTIIARMTDKSAPAVSCTAARKRLPRPTRQLVDVGLRLQVEDDMDAQPEVAFEVFADGGSGRDVQALADGRLALRAAPGAFGADRIYLIAVSATDAMGNRGTAACSVVVPSSTSPADVSRALRRGAAAEEHYRRTGEPPSGFAPLGGLAGDGGPAAPPREPAGV
jgi:hypothetical protein